MTEVIIRNKELLGFLDEFVDEFFSIEGYDDPYYHMFDPKTDARERGEYYVSEEYLRDHVWKDYQGHSGFPTQHFSQPVSQMTKKNPKWFDIEFKVKKKFPEYLGAHSSALFNYYPPGGFVGWHTNWNANAYQVLFTWSRDGNGYFQYYDMQKDGIVTIQDKPGWQCRWYYFGRKDEPGAHCWHSAYAGCDRITLAYKILNNKLGTDDDRRAIMLRDYLLEDIENE